MLLTSAAVNGALLVACASENAKMAVDTESAITEIVHACCGRHSQPITITINGMENCRLPGRSNRLTTCHRKNRRTIVPPLVGDIQCSANNSNCPRIRPAPFSIFVCNG